MKTRLLITGGSGLLGSCIVRMTIRDFEVYATYYSHPDRIPGSNIVPLEIRDKQQVTSVFARIKPVLVIHTAALADVDYCEEHLEEAWSVNVEGTENIALASKEVGAKLIYISTDSVFDGQKGMYTEADAPNPINTYARTKLEGEVKVRERLPDSVILRTAFYGWSPGSQKRSLAEWVVSGLSAGNTLSMFTDVFFSPIFTGNLIEVILEIYRQGLNGIYHAGGRERCSKYAFGEEVARAFGLDRNLIQPSPASKAGLKAPRPKDISLDVTRVSGKIKTPLLNVREGIARFKNSKKD